MSTTKASHTPGPWMTQREIITKRGRDVGRLLAAAPDLLAACEDIESKILFRVRAAIKKAEGEK